jgi:hypothetical protein
VRRATGALGGSRLPVHQLVYVRLKHRLVGAHRRLACSRQALLARVARSTFAVRASAAGPTP